MSFLKEGSNSQFRPSLRNFDDNSNILELFSYYKHQIENYKNT